jgi:predicted nucleic acid-binding protein
VIVVDTNVICYLLMPGERTAAAERLYRTDPEWIAPRLWLDELLNVLATSERQAFLDADQAAAILRDAVDLMQDGTYEVPPERVLAIARRTGCSAYDSQFIALAEDRHLKLNTWDRKILERCPELAVAPR